MEHILIHRRRSELRRAPVTQPRSYMRAVADFAVALQVESKSPTTVRLYAHTLGWYGTWLTKQGVERPTLADLNALNARRFIKEAQDEPIKQRINGTGKRQKATIRLYTTILKAFATHVHKERWTRTNQLSSLVVPALPKRQVKPFDVEELRLLAIAATQTAFPERDTAILLLGISTGMRAGEIGGLLVDRVNWNTGAIRIIGKGDKERLVRADPEAITAMLIYLQARKVNTPFLFQSATGLQMTSPRIYEVIAGLGKIAGVSNCHPHRLRHSFAREWLRAHPQEILGLKARMGHSSLDMTNHYAAVGSMDDETPNVSLIRSLGISAAV